MHITTGDLFRISGVMNGRSASIVESAATSRGFADGASKMSGEATRLTNATFPTATDLDDLDIHLTSAPRRLSFLQTVRAVNTMPDAVPLRLDVVSSRLFAPFRTAPTTCRKTRCCSLRRGNCIVRTVHNSSDAPLEHFTGNRGRNFCTSVSGHWSQYFCYA